MKLGIMQPYFFPYIFYWQLINVVDVFVIYDDVNYIKNGWIHRNRILMNGKGSYITIPLMQTSSFKKINEIELYNKAIYSKKILRTIESCYKKAPYFCKTYPYIANIISQDENRLSVYLEKSIRRVCDLVSIDTDIILSSSIKKNNDLSGQDKIIEICRILGASKYVNAVGGSKLYSEKEFALKGLKLTFLDNKEFSYKQFNNSFVPNLSIIDILMFNSLDVISKMLNRYSFC